MNDKIDCNNCFNTLPEKLLLKCSNGNIVLNNLTLLGGNTIQNFNQPIANVSIDTACFCNPELLIDFTGILTVTPLDSTAVMTFTFTLFRICEGIRTPQAVSTFEFNYTNIFPPYPDSRTLIFEYSPCDDQCKECCTYILELTSIYYLFPVTTNISINGTLCALAVKA
ncbi:DUF4489 domain-containing protein [Aminipila sp.]|uniref:DUF4489 domain-containing protein n=1 Tax=Aminipila sp. TaxID=2060095 RepID=UPI00289EFB50|nr:DUF4489 domain-containing protein [Aminipila sp.]